MKKELVLVLIVCFLFLAAFSVTALCSPGDFVDIFVNYSKIEINGERSPISNILYDNKTYVSIRDICDSLGLDLKWDENTKTAKITDPFKRRASSALNNILYILSRSLVLSGMLILAQIVFGRMKKDFYFVKKFSSSTTGLKRLIYTGSISRMGFYFIVSGILTGIPASGANPSVWVKFIVVPILMIILWFLGLSAANSISKREYEELIET